MATLVLSTVGTLVGGPIGGAIGALIGQSVDARLFAPPGREGPRLADLRVQTSSYGTAIPMLFGTMRVSGTVIWATDLKEHRSTQSNGKGRGSTTSYSYSVSMAVALSCRPAIGIGRIWAEGNILRGAGGDFKSPVTMRFHDGGPDQAADPLIAAAEGMADCPAYRGTAYVVLEDFDLSPFGNRIPSLTFELIADAGLTLAAPVATLLGTRDASDAPVPIIGCALGAGTIEQAVGALEPLVPAERAGADWRVGRQRAATAIALGEAAGDGAAPRASWREGGDGAASTIAIECYDPARDFQLIRAASRIAGGDGPAELLSVPMAIDAGTAKSLAGQRAAAAALARRSASWPQGFAALAIPPGAAVQAEGFAGARVDERRIEGAGVVLTLTSDDDDALAMLAGDGGRAIASPDEQAGVTRAALFDLPARDGGDGGLLLLGAAGTGPGWRRGQVTVQGAAGADTRDMGAIGAAVVLGTVETADCPAVAGLLLNSGAIIVALANTGMTLDNADDAALIGGANLAMLGDELIQFGHAAPLGGLRWRLTRLLRGRLGSDAAMADPMAGRGFALARDAALLALPLPPALDAVGPGAAVVIGSPVAPSLTLAVGAVGRARVPLSPVHGQARWTAAGALDLGWVRRSRRGFGWDDGVDVPLDMPDERYQVACTAGAASLSAITAGPALTLGADDVAVLRAAAPILSIRIQQIGGAGLSPPLTLSVALA